MVQLKHLERSLETSLNEGSIASSDSVINDFLNDNESISRSNSARLHDALVKIWNAEVNSPNNDDTESENVLTPVSTKSADSSKTSKPDDGSRAGHRKVVFLEALNRLGPCLINTDQLQVWWSELSIYAIDSSGCRVDVVALSRDFIIGVITGSFYEYGDAKEAELFKANKLLYGRSAIELYLSKSIPENAKGEVTEERVRFIRQNCRDLFGHFGRSDTKAAFMLLNEYFVKSSYRLDCLDLLVEYLSGSQNSKLFRIYDTPFFESLLKCLENDQSKIVLQLASTSLSLLLVHICDKLEPTGLLFRVYALFGRVCSWQPQFKDFDEEALKHDTGYVLDARSEPRSSEQASGTLSDPATKEETSNEPLTGWQKVEEQPCDSKASEIERTIDIVPLFMFLYGLFPINTLHFCRQADEYLAMHDYKRTFSDHWSRFMVTGKVDAVIRQFRVDPLFIMSTEAEELANSVQRFQAIGSTMGQSSIITSRKITEPETDVPEEEINDKLDEHRRDFQMQPEDSAAHWQRELLLMRNELAFAQFSRDMSEQRTLRWQKRASKRAIVDIRNEVLSQQNEQLRVKVGRLEDETQKALRSARIIMRERSGYEAKILERNRDNRDQIAKLEKEITTLREEANSARAAEELIRQQARENRDLAASLEGELKALRLDDEGDLREEPSGRRQNQSEIESMEDGNRLTPVPENDSVSAEVPRLRFQIENLKKERDEMSKQMQREIEAAQNETARALANRVTPRHDSLKSISPNAVIKENTTTITRLKASVDELSRKCASLEHELRARKVHEEERLNELQATLMNTAPYTHSDYGAETRFRGRGGAQGVPRRS